MQNNVVPSIDMNKYPNINRGLEGLVVLSSENSLVDGEKGSLTYAGYSIDTLVEHSTFEETTFLLWNKRLPTKPELEELKKKLIENRELPLIVQEYLKTTRKDAEPIAVMRTAVSMLSDFDDEATLYKPEANYRKAIRIMAKIPAIIAGYQRAREGKDIIEPLKEGSTAYNFLYMLNGEHPGENAEKVMDTCLILHAEHGMNASTFVNRSICSSHSDIYSSITGAIGSLKGPLHGGANRAVMNMLLKIDKKNPDIENFINERLEKGKKIMGFGHRVYKTIDPRSIHLKRMAKGLAKETDTLYLYEWSKQIVEIMKKKKGIHPNVDFFSASVYYAMGIHPDLYTCIFAMSRVSGWVAHYIEQAANNRLIRPRQLYIGEINQPWIPMEER